ncbi:polyribonucleotide nucleotidyltransferase mitochondrial [Raphidocelis subcapitata]|uniref:polyribonucleotide nucleotidyltransferase n=1 Tax=Raphidocelis subcapitata TaxID=307507 RepID=A0A2V0P2F0_9CHLO|nr:polyribonucleotide nucleotidyltransferase mitochondrial [Raphidocelis subcapitata]|eukprot:GBF93759.1 polyribonucleotide nucleotidyltransferase mitochondrial [Raphidocelis subcapitata]
MALRALLQQRLAGAAAQAAAAAAAAGGSGAGAASGCSSAAAAGAARAVAAASSSARWHHSLCVPPSPDSTAAGPLAPPQQQPWPWAGGPAPGGRGGSGSSGVEHGGSGGSGGGGGGGEAPPPMVCGHPKDKISHHRRSHRRRIYYRKPQELLASCRRQAAAFSSAAAAPSPSGPDPKTARAQASVGGRTLTWEAGRLAALADGACVARFGGCVVLSTVVVDPTPLPDADGPQLQVEFRERAYAHGRVPARADRREASTSDREVLAGRAVDRALRPLMAPGYHYTVQLINTLLSSDDAIDPEVLAINAASVAMLRAGVPWGGPVGAVRVGLVEGELVANPSPSQTALSDLSLTYAGASGARAIMVEAAGDEVPDAQIADALRFAAAAVEPLLAPQLSLFAPRGRALPLAPAPPALRAAVESLAGGRAREIFGDGGGGGGKLARGAAVAELQADLISGLRAKGLLPDAPGGASAPSMFSEAAALRALDALASRALRDGLLAGRRRPDGRGAGELRGVAALAGVLPRAVHGSGLFERGDTQCLAAATIAPEREAVAADGGAAVPASSAAPLAGSAATASGAAAAAAADASPAAAAARAPGGAPADARGAAKRLLLHYSFPPFCTGEVGKLGPPGRREVGHGALAEKALAPLMPPPDVFPFWARVSAETLGSSGSSSMAAVCAGSVALRTAGVPLEDLGAGISIGLAVERPPQLELPASASAAVAGPYVPGAGAGACPDYGRSVLLTDIQGLEDHLGDMDFKVAGTRSGITALQLDTKLPGLPVQLLADALAPASEARAKIIAVMEAALEASDARMQKALSPQHGSVEIDRELVPRLIGLQGVNLLDIEAKTGARLIVADSGDVFIYAPTRRQYDHAVGAVLEVEGRSIREGDTYRVRVFKVSDYGAHVQLPNGMPALVHISQWAHHRVKDIQEVASEGMELEVKCMGRDARGQIILSRKALLKRAEHKHRVHPRPKPAAGGEQQQPQGQEPAREADAPAAGG